MKSKMNVTTIKTWLKKLPLLPGIYRGLQAGSKKALHLASAPGLIRHARRLSQQQIKLPTVAIEIRPKPHLLLLTDYNWVPGSDFDTAFELWGISLQEAEVATFQRLTFPQRYHEKRSFLEEIYALCSRHNPRRPDYVFFALGGDFSLFPPPAVWNEFLTACPVPMLALLADTVPQFIAYLEKIPLLGGVVSIDAAAPAQQSRILQAKAIFLPSPNCTALFYDQPGKRHKCISFMGLTTYRYSRRARALEVLRNAGLEIYSGGGYLNRVPLAAMAEVYRDSQFVLNFAETDTYFQCKGRVMEATLCGACLIERDNPETNHWLRPDIDYVAYHTIEQIPEKIKYLLAHQEEYERIRQSGKQRAAELFGAKNVWTKIMAFAQKISPPRSLTEKQKNSPTA